jgi:hypothetical protein
MVTFISKDGKVSTWNLIGFNFGNSSKRYGWQADGWDGSTEYRHCPFHAGTRLLRKKDQPGVLQCPKCGSTYLENEAPNEEGIEVKHGKQQAKIITGKKKKKYYDKNGNLINDEQLLKDIANGKVVISYNEQKSGEERHIVKK